jgi:hypothetical protein
MHTIAERLQAAFSSEELTSITSLLCLNMPSIEEDTHIRQIATRSIVAWEFRAGSVQWWRRAFTQGRRVPPIQAYRHIFADTSQLYTLMDGNHRAIAAQQISRRQISAVVLGITRQREDPLVFHNGRVWEYVPERRCLTDVLSCGELDDALTTQTLVRLGLLRVWNPTDDDLNLIEHGTPTPMGGSGGLRMSPYREETLEQWAAKVDQLLAEHSQAKV